MTGYIYLNGKVVSADTAGVSVDDIGLLRGYGVFDVIRTFKGKPFLLDRHLARFQKSAALLNLDLPHTLEQITLAVSQLLAKNLPARLAGALAKRAGRQAGYAESSIRIVLTGGPLIGGIEYNPKNSTFFIGVSEFPQLDKKIFTEGIKLVTAEHQRILPEAKTLNYIVAVREWPRVKKAGAAELLYTWRGKVLEASTSNFFVVKGKRLITPKEEVLLGTTRNLLLELAKDEFPIEEREVGLEELAEADEAFITATNKDLMPVVQIDDRKIGSGAVGPVSQRLMDKFYEYAQSSAYV